MLWPVVKALLGHYRRHPLQLLLVLFGLTLGVSIFVGVTAINHHAKESYKDGEKFFANPLPYRITPKFNANKIPQGFYIQLRRDGFHQCVPFDTVQIETKKGQDISLVGIDPVAMIELGLSVGSNQLSHFQLMQQGSPVLLSQELASHLRKQAGDQIELKNGTSLGPVIIDKNKLLDGTLIVADMSLVRSLKRQGGFSSIACANMPEQKLKRLKSIIPNGMEFSKNSKAELESITQAFHMNLTAMGMLSFVVGLFIFYQAISLSFIQRQPMVGILRQAGVSGWQLAKALILELVILILSGWIYGNVFGLMLANKLMPAVSTTLSDLYNANVSLTIDWDWMSMVQSLGMAVFGTVLACTWPMIRLLRSQPIRLTARLSLVRFAGREFSWQAFVACVLCVIAAALYQVSDSPQVGFIIVALLLISVALFMPFVIFELFTVLSFSLKWVKARWFFADAAASMSFRGVAVMAFMLAMSANVAVETLVGSFRETTDNWLNQKLAADMYIYPTSSSVSRISRWLEKQPEVEDVWWRWEKDVSTSKGMLEVVSTGQSLAERNAVTVKLAIPNFWYHLNGSRGLMVSESMALKDGIRPGDYITLGSATHTTLAQPRPADKWQVVGVYYDYGNPYRQVLLSHNNWMELFDGKGNVGLGVVLKPDAGHDTLTDKLQASFRMSTERIFNNKDIHSQAMRVFDRTFVIADTLGNLTLIIAVCGIFFATIAGEISKQRNIALLRCFGMSGKELVFLSCLQLFVFGVISALVAMPLGLALAQIMVEVVLKESFGWTMHLYVIPWKYFNTFMWAMIALVIAGAIPVVGMVKRTPMKSLRDAL